MTVDLSPIVAPVALLLLTAATSALGVATRALLVRFHVANAADLAAKVDYHRLAPPPVRPTGRRCSTGTT